MTNNTDPRQKMQAALAQKEAEQLKSFYTFNAKLLQFFKGIDEQFKALLNEPNLDKAVVDEIMQQTKAAIPDLNNLKYEMDMLDETVISNACRNDLVKLQKYITETMVLSQASFTKENFIALLEKNKSLFAAEKEQEKEKREKERQQKIRKEEAQEQAKKQEKAERLRKIAEQKAKERLDFIRIEKEIEVKLRLEIEQKEKERLEKIRKEEAQEQAKKQAEAERLRKIEEQKEKERLDIIRIEKEIEVKLRLEEEKNRKEEENKEKERQLKLKQQQEEEARQKALEIEMVTVEGGMLSGYNVELSSYLIGKFQVTQELWKSVMGSNPSSFREDENLPVINVNYISIMAFISELNAKTDMNYRLPSHTEWIFAAKGGVKSKGFKYPGSNNIYEVAWFNGNSGNRLHPVGKKKPNELELYDMSGNVREFCLCIQKGGPTLPVLISGSYIDCEKQCEGINTLNYGLYHLSSYAGFRLVRDP